MKIDDSTGKLPLSPASTGRSGGTRAELAPAAQPTERVSLSGSGKALAGTAGAPIDLAKVEQIRVAIANGSFRLDVERIVDNVITGSRELLRRD